MLPKAYLGLFSDQELRLTRLFLDPFQINIIKFKKKLTFKLPVRGWDVVSPKETRPIKDEKNLLKTCISYHLLDI